MNMSGILHHTLHWTLFTTVFRRFVNFFTGEIGDFPLSDVIAHLDTDLPFWRNFLYSKFVRGNTVAF